MSEGLTFSGSYAFGVVENVADDELRINQVQVRLFVIHEQDPAILPTGRLPWAQVLLPTTENEASSHNIKIGMVVKCSFLDGIEMQRPVVEGILPGIVDTGESVTGNTDKTLSKYADNRNVTKKPTLDDTQPADPYAAKYPENRVIEFGCGHRIEIDETEGAERIHFYHKTGSNTEFHPDGSVVTAITKDEYTVVKGNSTHVIKKDKIVTVEGNETIKVKGNSSLEVDGDLTADVKGKVNVKAGGDVTFESGGNATNKVAGDYTVEVGGSYSVKAGGAASMIAGGIATVDGTSVMLG